ncbi:MAG: hypothetical protein L3K18_08505 [Thermoplasmata archaeon]|nr:hypothetical protein [Thermoplasmata archaeon]MCI4357156.1 hypothetical protein [Thermoplasmata archaeon]
MAKKARRKLDEDTPETRFQFPDFEVEKFLRHEFEQTFATMLAIGLAVALAVVSWALDRAGLPYVVPAAIGVAVIAFSPFLIQRLRPAAEEYTKGDWVGLILTEAFGWLGIWFLLLDVLRL